MTKKLIIITDASIYVPMSTYYMWLIWCSSAAQQPSSQIPAELIIECHLVQKFDPLYFQNYNRVNHPGPDILYDKYLCY